MSALTVWPRADDLDLVLVEQERADIARRALRGDYVNVRVRDLERVWIIEHASDDELDGIRYRAALPAALKREATLRNGDRVKREPAWTTERWIARARALDAERARLYTQRTRNEEGWQ